MLELEIAVDAGAEALTSYFQTDRWVNAIDEDTLDLNNIFDCVLGQLFGNYCHAPDALFDDREELGFCAGDGDYPLLTALWVRKIRGIRKARAL